MLLDGEAPEGPRTIQALGTFLGCLPELVGKTLLIKTLDTLTVSCIETKF